MMFRHALIPVTESISPVMHRRIRKSSRHARLKNIGICTTRRKEEARKQVRQAVLDSLLKITAPLFCNSQIDMSEKMIRCH